MEGGERVIKRSCHFCVNEARDELESQLLEGHISPKEIDKNMSWRSNTADRHFRNHMGDYHLAANPSCPVCSSVKRADYEFEFFNNSGSTDAIAAEMEIGENVVYNHMKNHFQPLVQKTAALEVALTAGREIELLRSNAQKLNSKLTELLDDGSVHEDGFVRDAVILHKEVRETVKDLLRFQDQWGPQTDGKQINQTINVLQIELSKESPETWTRIKKQLAENMGME